MKKIKNKKGITLITLVVTLIVLLIIAGITISSTYSEKGIIDNIKRKNAESVIEEEIKNTIMGRAYTTGVFTPRKYEYAI